MSNSASSAAFNIAVNAGKSEVDGKFCPQPAAVGLPFPRAMLEADPKLSVMTASGEACVAQTTVTQCWPDGSPRWVLVEWAATQAQAFVSSAAETSGESGTQATGCSWTGDHRAMKIDTGLAVFELAGDTEFPCQQVQVRGVAQIAKPMALSAAPLSSSLKFSSLEILRAGAACVRVSSQATLAELEVRVVMSFFAGSALMRIELELTNPCASGHPRGTWDLGNKGSIYLSDVSFYCAVSGKLSLTEAFAQRSAALSNATDWRLFQASSGGANWDSPAHMERDSRTHLPFSGYQVSASDGEVNGACANPDVCVRSDTAGVRLAMRDFWQNFPKAIASTDGSLRLGVFPSEYTFGHELQGGERKSHELWLSFGVDSAREELVCCVDGNTWAAEPQWYAAAQALPHLTPRCEHADPSYFAIVDKALDPVTGFEAKRELVDEYGWRHFGEQYADHETKYHKGPQALVSHYNNQYDSIFGFGVNFLRSADARWFELFDDLARHVSDIDLYHTERDRAAFNHGMFWHTGHYHSAARATHRTYPSEQGVGGGLSPEHVYATGLLLHYWLTGQERSRDAVIGLGEFVINSDDGAKSMFRWVDRGFTGNASRSGSESYHGPGRGPGNAIETLLSAFVASADRRFLDKAEALIARCISAADDLVEIDLGNVEERWYYTVMLKSLTRYLEIKHEISQYDERYVYARDALIHYVTWMAENEYPYLDKPEKLEFPTETWAAQEMRKSDVFNLASQFVADPMREEFQQRAQFFFRTSVDTLLAMPTHTWTRPLALIMAYGWIAPWFLSNPRESLPSASDADVPNYAPRPAFVMQKNRVKRLIKRGAMLGAVVVAIGSATLAWSLLAS